LYRGNTYRRLKLRSERWCERKRKNKKKRFQNNREKVREEERPKPGEVAYRTAVAIQRSRGNTRVWKNTISRAMRHMSHDIMLGGSTHKKTHRQAQPTGIEEHIASVTNSLGEMRSRSACH
jgi:hypothetical protein